MNKQHLQLLIYLSALLVTQSVFLPLTSFPVYGEVSYFRIARLESILLFVCALTAPAFILAGRNRLAILSPIGVWLVLLFPALREAITAGNNNAVQQVGGRVSSAMKDFSADLFLNISDFHWGGLVFLLALLIFTLAGVLYQVKL